MIVVNAMRDDEQRQDSIDQTDCATTTGDRGSRVSLVRDQIIHTDLNHMMPSAAHCIVLYMTSAERLGTRLWSDPICLRLEGIP